MIRKQGLEDAQTDTVLQSPILDTYYDIIAIFQNNICSTWHSTASITTYSPLKGLSQEDPSLAFTDPPTDWQWKSISSIEPVTSTASLQQTFLSISSPQGNLELYRDPLWTFKSLHHFGVSQHKLCCVWGFFLIIKKGESCTPLFTFTQSALPKRNSVLWNHPRDHCCTMEVTGFSCAWVPPVCYARTHGSSCPLKFLGLHVQQLGKQPRMIYWYYY